MPYSNTSILSRRPFTALTLCALINLSYSSLTHAELAFSPNGQQLSLPIPETYSSDQGVLAVQINGYDVSNFVDMSETAITVALDAPIEPGPHSVQVLLFGNDGSISTLLDSEATFAANQEFPIDWQVSTTLSHTYLADEKNFPQDGEDHHTGGGIEAHMSQSREGWSWDAGLSGIYDSNSQNSADLNEWAIAQYRLAAQAQGENINGGITFGHVQPQRESLIFSYFERRGIASHISSADNAHKFEVFAMRSDPTSRYDGSLNVPGDSDIRSIGGESTVTLIDQKLLFSVGYIDGNTDQGVSDPDFRQVFGGNAWNAALDAYAFSQQLWLHAEYARSDFDNDGLDEGEASQSDSASQAVVQWSSESSEQSWLDYWRAQLRYQEVGPDFYSIGNLSIPGDVSLYQGRLEGGSGSLNMAFEISQEKTNVDDNSDKATQTLNRSDISLSYAPYVDTESGTWSVLGSPSISGGITQSDHSQPRSDSIKQGFDLDQSTLETRIELGFNANHYNWGLSVQRVDIDDKTSTIIQGTETIYEPGSDQVQNSFGINGGWAPNNRFAMNLFAQWSRQKEEDFDNNYDSSNFGIDSQYLIIPETLDLVMSYNHGVENSDFGDPGYLDGELQSNYGSARLTWYCLQAKNRMPGLATYINGVWNRQQDKTFESSDESWAIYLGLDLSWAVSGAI